MLRCLGIDSKPKNLYVPNEIFPRYNKAKCVTIIEMYFKSSIKAGDLKCLF
jgi:hypothetical protein